MAKELAMLLVVWDADRWSRFVTIRGESAKPAARIDSVIQADILGGLTTCNDPPSLVPVASAPWDKDHLGSNELPFLDDFPADFRYIYSLHERRRGWNGRWLC